MYLFVFVYKKNQSEKYEKHSRAGRLGITLGLRLAAGGFDDHVVRKGFEEMGQEFAF